MATLGQVAYEAYCIAVNTVSFSGVTLPKWEGSTDNIRDAWEQAALAVIKEYQKGVVGAYKRAAVKSAQRKRIR